jgi:hypothetical protein
VFQKPIYTSAGSFLVFQKPIYTGAGSFLVFQKPIYTGAGSFLVFRKTFPHAAATFPPFQETNRSIFSPRTPCHCAGEKTHTHHSQHLLHYLNVTIENIALLSICFLII